MSAILKAVPAVEFICIDVANGLVVSCLFSQMFNIVLATRSTLSTTCERFDRTSKTGPSSQETLSLAKWSRSSFFLARTSSKSESAQVRYTSRWNVSLINCLINCFRLCLHNSKEDWRRIPAAFRCSRVCRCRARSWRPHHLWRWMYLPWRFFQSIRVNLLVNYCPKRLSSAGADFVMAGGMFAGHDQSGGDVVEENGKKFKLFYGMSSSTAMDKHSGGVANYRASEGKTVKIPYRGDLNNTIRDILGGVRSTCT